MFSFFGHVSLLFPVGTARQVFVSPPLPKPGGGDLQLFFAVGLVTSAAALPPVSRRHSAYLCTCRPGMFPGLPMRNHCTSSFFLPSAGISRPARRDRFYRPYSRATLPSVIAAMYAFSCLPVLSGFAFSMSAWASVCFMY